MVEIHSYIESTSAEGPYLRFALWVQGCSIRCLNCANQHMWERNKGRMVTVNRLFEKIRAQSDIEGITFLGGEPFDQAEELSELAQKSRKTGLGIVTFTGYTYEQIIQKASESHLRLLDQTDLLIDGPFQDDLRTNRLPWVGSSNQRYIHLTGRYDHYDFKNACNRIEVRLCSKDGKITVNGLDDINNLNQLIENIRDTGII